MFVAEENLNRAKEYFTYSQQLASKGYVNETQLEADKFAVEKATKELDAAKTKLKVLDDFTKAKMVSTLESAIVIAKAKWESAQNSHELEDREAQGAGRPDRQVHDDRAAGRHRQICPLENWGGDSSSS